MDGTEVCKVLRSQESTASVPIIMLTARTEEEDRISGLDLGADDYVSKPFSVKELIARVRAVLRRTGARDEQEQVLAAGPVEIDLPAHRVLVAGEPVELTRKEFDLLTALIRSRGRVLTRDHLLERVWGYAYPGETRTVDVHIRRLRKKLGDRVKDHIETVVGVGYRFRSDR
jgi:two-component system alkaline phosphatase synthesis response regulator PhoP